MRIRILIGTTVVRIASAVVKSSKFVSACYLYLLRVSCMRLYKIKMCFLKGNDRIKIVFIQNERDYF